MPTLPLFGSLFDTEDPRSEADLRKAAEGRPDPVPPVHSKQPDPPEPSPEPSKAGPAPSAPSAPAEPAPKLAAPKAAASSRARSKITPEEDSAPREERVYRVSQLNRAVRGLLEDRFNNVWVEGELSDVTRAASGHVYATLNDEDEPAQIRVVIFKNDARRSKAKLEDGARVKLQGQLSLFTPRGSYQLIARIAVPYGLGELHAHFERVRVRLEADGLLAPERKRPLPLLPRVIGIVTSEHGAALHDIVRVAHSRCPVRLVLSPCLVQGAQAPASIIAALEHIQKLPELDLVIVGRGGGSAEDLVAWNDERLARSIASCRVPVVSAVGHEVDVSISDLVADMRAATPSNAAELCVPERQALLATLREQERALSRGIEVRIGRQRLRVERMAQRLRDPRTTLSSVRARVEALRTRLLHVFATRRQRERLALQTSHERLSRLDPRLLLAQRRALLVRKHAQLTAAITPRLMHDKSSLAQLAGRLDALSPLGILSRGYAIALHAPTGKALMRAQDASPGDLLHVRLHEGTLQTRVLAAEPDADAREKRAGVDPKDPA